MLKRIINRVRYIRDFLSCNHNFKLKGTIKRKGEILIVCNCQKCNIETFTNVKQTNELAKIYSIKL